MIRPRPPRPASRPTPLQAVADSHLRAVADSIHAALRRVRRTLTIADAESQIINGGLGSLTADWSQFWTLTKADPNYEATYLSVVMDGAELASAQFQTAFTLVNPRAVQIAQTRAAELVVGLSRDSAATLNQTIAAGLGGVRDVRASARILRDVVGLDPRRAQGLVTYRLGLSANLSVADVDRLTATYSERALAQRAITIARTETMRAAHDGQRALWDEAIDQGLLDPSRTRTVWLYSDDGRGCDECAALDGTTVSIGDAYGHGEDMIDGPPAHPQCRCSLALEFDN